jgi:hypothetical protein
MSSDARFSKAHVAFQHACNELISTERTHVDCLCALDEVFRTPLRTWASEDTAKGGGGVTAAEVDAIFGTIATLLDINRRLLEQLEKSATRPPADVPGALAATMAKFAAEDLRMYAPHVSKFAMCEALLQKLLKQRPRFAAAVKVLELQPEPMRLRQRLDQLLVNTVQRLPRYRLLLEEMIKRGEEMGNLDAGAAAAAGASGADTTEKLKLALENVRKCTGRVAERAGDQEDREKAMRIARDRFRRNDLVAPNRIFVKEGSLQRSA